MPWKKGKVAMEGNHRIPKRVGNFERVPIATKAWWG